MNVTFITYAIMESIQLGKVLASKRHTLCILIQDIAQSSEGQADTLPTSPPSLPMALPEVYFITGSYGESLTLENSPAKLKLCNFLRSLSLGQFWGQFYERVVADLTK